MELRAHITRHRSENGGKSEHHPSVGLTDLRYELVDRPTQLICNSDIFFVELAVVTPVEWRNFVSVVSEARKSKPGPMSF